MKLQAESLPFPRPLFPSKREKSGNATVKFALSSVNCKWVPWRDCCSHCCSKPVEGPGDSHLWSLDPTKKSHPPGPFPASSATAAGAASTSQDFRSRRSPASGRWGEDTEPGACTGLRSPSTGLGCQAQIRTVQLHHFTSGVFFWDVQAPNELANASDF